MKYKPTKNQKIINQKHEDEVEMRERMFQEIASYKHKNNFKQAFLDRVNTFKKRFLNTEKLTNQRKYKEKNLKHSQKSIEQWTEFFRGLELEKINQNRFFDLLLHNGIPDIKNPYLNMDEKYYQIHPDIMFFVIVECVLEFLMKNDLRKKELAKNYDLFLSFASEIKRAEELQKEIKRIKDETEERKVKLKQYFDENVDGFKPLDKSVMSSYEEQNKVEYEKYLKLTDEYNSLVLKIPNTIEGKKDEIYFSKIINCANLGLLMLREGDFFLPETFESIDDENLRFFFISSILLCSKELFEQTNFEKFKQSIYQLNKKSKHVILPVNYIDEIVAMRKENYQYTIQNFNLEKTQLELESKVRKEQQEFEV